MDIMLPRMNGLQATRFIRQHPKTRFTPVLAMTAKVTQQDKRDCFQSGCNNHIGKPFKARQLIACVEELLDQASEGHMDHEEDRAAAVG